MKTNVKKLKRFYLGLLAPLLVFALYFTFSARLLIGAGEYMGTDAVTEKLAATPGYYGLAVLQKTFYYKQSIFRHEKPDVVALGSSRALQFHREDFTIPFANLGGMSGLDEVDEMAHDLFILHPPKLLILGVDFWWFNPASEGERLPRSPENARVTAADLLKPLGWILSGKLSPHDISLALGGNAPDIGIAAIQRKDGFDRYGAYYYTSTYTGAQESDDPAFKVSLGKIRDSAGVFVHGNKISAERWRKFMELLDFLQEQHIKTIIFMPPMAPSVANAMQANGNYAYVDIVRRKLKETARNRHLPFFNFHDIRSIGSSDCEFKDGFHGGETAYERLLLQIALDDADTRRTLNLPRLGWNIQHYEGRASANMAEVDFLGIGCDKGLKSQQ